MRCFAPQALVTLGIHAYRDTWAIHAHRPAELRAQNILRTIKLYMKPQDTALCAICSCRSRRPVFRDTWASDRHGWRKCSFCLEQKTASP